MKVKFEITLIFLLFGLLISNHLISQEISKPEFYINNNEITSTAICANQNVPNRSVIAKYTGPAGYFGIGTVFVLELSDENGVFQDTPLELSRLTLSFAISSTKDLDFGPFTIPQDLRGENYSLRVIC